MPSLFRFLTLIGVLGGLTYGAMFMLATWFDPKPREITVSIPAGQVRKAALSLPQWPRRPKTPTKP